MYDVSLVLLLLALKFPWPNSVQVVLHEYKCKEQVVSEVADRFRCMLLGWEALSSVAHDWRLNFLPTVQSRPLINAIVLALR